MNAADDVEDLYPLTPAQLGMLVFGLQNPQSDAYQVQVQLTFQRLDAAQIAHLEARWAQLVDHHPILRTTLLWDDLDEPLQVVQTTVPSGWQRQQEIPAPRIPLDAPVLWSWHVFDDGNGRTTLCWCFHHILLDGWSSLRLLQALFADTAPPPPITSFRKQVDWVRARNTEPMRTVLANHWRTTLSDVQPTSLPQAANPWPSRITDLDAGCSADTPPAPATRPLRDEQALSEEITEPLKNLARTLRCTLTTLVHTAWGLALARLCGTDRVVFGMTSAGRPSTLPGAADMIGLCLETLPLVLRFDSSKDQLQDWLPRLQRQQLQAVEHGGLGLNELRKLCPGAGQSPLLSTLVVSHGFPADFDLADGPLQPLAVTFQETSEFPVALLWKDDDAFASTLIYQPDQIDSQAAQSLHLLFAHHLAQLSVATPYSSTGSLNTLPRSMEQQLSAFEGHVTGHDETVPAEQESVALTIQRQMHRYPEHCAVRDEAASLTYGELHVAATALAACLARDNPNAAPVLLQLPADRRVVIALHACWLQGTTAVPVHLALPPERLEAIRLHAGAQLLLNGTGERSVASSSAVKDYGNDLFGTMLPALTNALVTMPWCAYAYVMFTSGSTGEPKGVAVHHNNLAYSTTIRKATYPAPKRFLMLSAPAFDSAMVGLCWPHCEGGTLVLASEAQRRDPLQQASLIEHHAITHLLCIPSLYAALLELAKPRQLESLQCVIVAGEACPAALPQKHAAVVPGAALYNEYGPTEATIWCSTAQLYDPADGRAEQPVTIGHAPNGTRLWLRGQDQRRTPPGAIGELVIEGPGVTGGYLQNQAISEFPKVADTRASYATGDLAQWDAAGRLHLRGRVDRQVKINGHRIELGALENALLDLSGVSEAAALTLATGGSGESHQIVACWSGTQTESALLEQALQRTLPGYAMPAHLFLLPALPRNANGKTDYRALSELLAFKLRERGAQARPASEAATEQPATLARLLNIIADVLALPSVAPADNFFALGGDSISALKVVTLARQASLPLEPAQIFDHPTAAALHRLLTTKTAPGSQGSVQSAPFLEATERTPYEDRGLLAPIEQWFFDLPLAQPGHWNQCLVYRFNPSCPEPSVSEVQGALQQLVERHPAFRSTYQRTATGWRRQVSDAATPLLWVQDLAPGTEPDPATLPHGFDLQKDCLLRGVLLRQPQARHQLLLISHHLAVDGVAWRVAADELETLLAGRSLMDRAPGATPDQWQAALRAAVHAGYFDGERPHWEALVIDAQSRRPPRSDDPRNREVSSTNLELAPAQTRQLLAAAGPELESWLLAAFVQSLSEELPPVIWREHHGRKHSIAQTTIADSVGWTTALHPLRWELQQGFTHQVTNIARALRDTPNDGLGYGALRYLHPESEVRDALRFDSDAMVVFNYLGTMGANADGELRLLAEDPTWLQRAARAEADRSPHHTEMNILIVNGVLRASITSHSDTLLRTLSEGFFESLTAALQPGTANRQTRPRPPADTDLNRSGEALSDQDLNRLLDGL